MFSALGSASPRLLDAGRALVDAVEPLEQCRSTVTPHLLLRVGFMRPRLDVVAATGMPPADEGMAATEAAMLMAPAAAEAAEAAGAGRRRHAQAQGYAHSPHRRPWASNARGLDRQRGGGATTSRRRTCRRRRPAPGEGGGIAPRRCAAAAPAAERRGLVAGTLARHHDTLLLLGTGTTTVAKRRKRNGAGEGRIMARRST